MVVTIAATDPRFRGPSAAIRLFGQALTRHGVKITVATTDDDELATRLNVPLQQLVGEPDGTMRIYFRRNADFYKSSWTLARWLRLNVADYDAVHTHALCSFSSFAVARAARRAGVPYVVRPLGALNRWGLKNRRRILKQWSLRWVELSILRGAAAIHYTAEALRNLYSNILERQATHE